MVSASHDCGGGRKKGREGTTEAREGDGESKLFATFAHRQKHVAGAAGAKLKLGIDTSQYSGVPHADIRVGQVVELWRT